MSTLKNAPSGKKLLLEAKSLAAKNGQRWTDMREAVFLTLLKQDKPATAYQMIDTLSHALNKNIKPATIYRALESLCKLGLVIKIESLNAFMTCSHPQDHNQHVLMICNLCGSANELHDDMIGKKLLSDAIHQGFKIERQILELQGACSACQH